MTHCLSRQQFEENEIPVEINLSNPNQFDMIAQHIDTLSIMKEWQQM